jgi:GH25 family lysozyme M1 (1,4-beta-N-acetylmuramidase)
MQTTTTSRASRRSRSTAVALVLAGLLAAVTLARPASATQGAGAAGSSGTARERGRPAVAAQPPPGSLPGMDVSHWQDAIDWTQVAASGRRFVFAKATEGRNFVDPMYSTYRAGATASGLAFGAYHFARPDASAGDAVLEADHFVDVAQLGSGDLLPVLDIEKDGGLDPADLTAWALAWLGEVRARLGVRPMVYTSPNGWANRFADTTTTADAGYPLWIAHWGVATPTLPANGWSGRGWVVWQHTDCGKVPGIHGCVDLDWSNGPDLGVATIRRLTVTVPTPEGVVTSSPAGISCGVTCSANFDPGTVVTLTPTPNPGAVFVGWGGACSGTGPCAVSMDADQAVTATFTSDLVPPTAELTPPASLTAPVTAIFSETVHEVTRSNVVLRRQGEDGDVPSTLTCRSAAGNDVRCSTGNVSSVELLPIAPLVAGQPYTAIVNPVGVPPVVDRAGNAAPTAPLDFGAATEVEQASAAVRAAWAVRHASSAYGGSYAVEHLAGASVSFDFRGRKVTWYTATGPSQGKAQVLIDGRPRGTFSQFASGPSFRVGRTFSGLAPGEHTITIRALGLAAPRAEGRFVVVDAFAVGPELVKTPPLETSWRTLKASRASGGSYAVADLAGSSVALTFRGTGVGWVTVRGPNQGRARILVDGTLVRTVDDYAANVTFGATRRVSGLTDGVHTLRIVVAGSSRKASKGALVAVDRFVVHPPVS